MKLSKLFKITEQVSVWARIPQHCLAQSKTSAYNQHTMLPAGNLAELVYLNGHPQRGANVREESYEEWELARTRVDRRVKGHSRGPLAVRMIMNEMNPVRTEKLQECQEAQKVKAIHFTILSRATLHVEDFPSGMQQENPSVAGVVIYI